MSAIRLARQILSEPRVRRDSGGSAKNEMNAWRELAGHIYGLHQQHMASGGMPDDQDIPGIGDNNPPSSISQRPRPSFRIAPAVDLPSEMLTKKARDSLCITIPVV